MGMEFKSQPLNLKDIDSKQGIVLSYPATFNVMDDGDDVIEAGAFAKTIREWGPGGKNRIKALYQHEPAWLVGKPMSLTEDGTGLLAETQFGRSAMAQDTLMLIEDGIITEESIGFDVIRQRKSGGTRHLLELRLWEYSYVTWGMNMETPIVDVKALGGAEDALVASMGRIEKALRKGAFKTDEVPHLLERCLKQWKPMAEELKRAGEAETSRPVVVREGKSVPNGLEIKAPDFDEVAQEQDLRKRGWRLLDALYSTFAGIIYDDGVEDKAATLAESIDQFKAAMVAWATEAQAQNVFTTMYEYWSSAGPEQRKQMLPGLLAMLQPEEHKAGKVLSKRNQGLVEDAIAALQALLEAAIADDASDEKSTRRGGAEAGAASAAPTTVPTDGHTGDDARRIAELLAPLAAIKADMRKDRLLRELRSVGSEIKGKVV
jgi:HK97 family phage prohead protease